MPPRARAVVVLCAALAPLSLPTAAHAAGQLLCKVERLGPRALARVSALELFDRELTRLVELGLVGRLGLEAVLYEKRRFWFDARAAEATRSFTVVFARTEARFTLDGRPLPNLGEVRFPELVLRPEGDGRGDFYLEVRVRLEVITAESLGEVARWLVQKRLEPSQPEPQQPQPPKPATLLPRALVGYLASDLARTATGRCAVPRQD